VGHGFVNFGSRGLVHVFPASGAGGAVLLACEHCNLDRRWYKYCSKKSKTRNRRATGIVRIMTCKKGPPGC
jgi:hypothetical protein